MAPAPARLASRRVLRGRQLLQLRNADTPDTGNKVLLAIDLAGATQSDLARGTGLTAQYVNDVARGRFHTITIDNAWIFADYFGVDPGDLFPARNRRAA